MKLTWPAFIAPGLFFLLLPIEVVFVHMRRADAAICLGILLAGLVVFTYVDVTNQLAKK